jgi:hypothetical protein
MKRAWGGGAGNDGGTTTPNSSCPVADSGREAVQGHLGAKKAAAVLSFSVFSRGRGRRSGGVRDGFEPIEREEQRGLTHSAWKRRR